MARHLIMTLSLVFFAAEGKHMRMNSTESPQELVVIIDSEQRNSSC
jgi:hypothetical protein